jgi:hypothetical protein
LSSSFQQDAGAGHRTSDGCGKSQSDECLTSLIVRNSAYDSAPRPCARRRISACGLQYCAVVRGGQSPFAPQTAQKGTVPSCDFRADKLSQAIFALEPPSLLDRHQTTLRVQLVR